MFRRVSGTHPEKHSVDGYNHTMKQNFEWGGGGAGRAVYISFVLVCFLHSLFKKKALILLTR